MSNAKSQDKNEKLNQIIALSKRRGFIYPSSEIYGGLANTYDFGPHGTTLKRNVQQLWWDFFIAGRDDNYGIDSSIIINPKVWEASGHIATFGDVMVEDIENRRRHRADHLIEDHFKEKGQEVIVDGKSAEELQAIIEKEGIKSPDGNELSQARKFNLLFETEIGIIEGDRNQAYLRGEIAQGLFINFKNVLDSLHPKLPFGIGQAGKAFRNEITKGQFTFRTLEFDLMEFEYFFDPEEQNWEELFEYWREQVKIFAHSLGLNPDRLRWRPHEEFELSHYSSRTEDLEYEFPWGFKEMFAVAYRTDFDLKNHAKKSGEKLEYVRPDGSKVLPHVIEPTFGLSRLITILLMDAYQEEEVNGSTRVVLKLAPQLAPVKAAVFPLQKDERIVQIAQQLTADLKVATHHQAIYDASGSIGKRYRRQDEIGTPFCITVDFDSLEDQSVTLRERDSMKQTRMPVAEVVEWVRGKVGVKASTLSLQ